MVTRKGNEWVSVRIEERKRGKNVLCGEEKTYRFEKITR